MLASAALLVQPGPGAHFASSIYTPDAGSAVLASLNLPAGTCNVVDKNPVSFRVFLQSLAEAVHVPKPFRFPGALGKAALGGVWSYLSRSQRVSNARFKKASGWKASVVEGWPLVAAALSPESQKQA